MEAAVFGLIGVVLGSVLTTIREVWLENRRQRQEREYVFIHLVYLLDNFINGCVDVSRDWGEADPTVDSGPTVKLPNFDLKSLDVQWKALPTKIMYEVFSFPTLIKNAKECIELVCEYKIDPSDCSRLFEERILQFSDLGLEAIKLSNKIRKVGNLPNFPEKNYTRYNREFNRRKILEEANMGVLETIEERHQRKSQREIESRLKRSRQKNT